MSDSARLYHASCHCGCVPFRFRSEQITEGRRCNCSICVRKGIVTSPRYYQPAEIENLEGESFLTVYRFGDKDVDHHFCRICGICPFHTVAKIPPTCTGPARPEDYRINLGCVQELDVYALDIQMIDGRSF